ncbi:hypothetical protein AYO21_08704 [Fonsecaea monophora]|uniref:Uncharacterized protein n=1 Tax=Fonsecaea monophora TaxID=254056 RepID=A0A177EZQ0_9EURO|nr:hypothetical protein AYO21_08704 [Fonsecaea monophora]KAH0848970.1 hypothetical protein FOPE_03078 [Fonsecaea pedrosoi]OAG37056.1 hypothetical protein AYO21_08704 [Fonsecaea monophora]
MTSSDKSAGSTPDSPSSSSERRHRRQSVGFLLPGDTDLSSGLPSSSSGAEVDLLATESVNTTTPTPTSLTETSPGLRRVHGTTNLNSLVNYPQTTDSPESEPNLATTASEDDSLESDHQVTDPVNNQAATAATFWTDEPGWSFAHIHDVTANSAQDQPNPLPIPANTPVTGTVLVWSDELGWGFGNIAGLAENLRRGLPNSLTFRPAPNSSTTQTLPTPLSQVDQDSSITQDLPSSSSSSSSSQAQVDLNSSSAQVLTTPQSQVDQDSTNTTHTLPTSQTQVHQGTHITQDLPASQSQVDQDPATTQTLQTSQSQAHLSSSSTEDLSNSSGAEEGDNDDDDYASEEAEEDGEWQAPEDMWSSDGEEEEEEDEVRVNLDEVDAPVAEQLRAGLAHLSEARVQIDVLDGDLPVGAVRGNPAAVRARAGLLSAEGEILGAVGQLWTTLAEAREVAVDAEEGFRQLQDEVRRLTAEYLAAQIDAALARERADSSEALLERAELEIAALREQLRDEQH